MTHSTNDPTKPQLAPTPSITTPNSSKPFTPVTHTKPGKNHNKNKKKKEQRKLKKQLEVARQAATAAGPCDLHGLKPEHRDNPEELRKHCVHLEKAAKAAIKERELERTKRKLAEEKVKCAHNEARTWHAAYTHKTIQQVNARLRKAKYDPTKPEEPESFFKPTVPALALQHGLGHTINFKQLPY